MVREEVETAPETWLQQWGDPRARNISARTLTPLLPEADKSNGTTICLCQFVVMSKFEV